MDAIQRFLKDDELCLILWVDEEHVDEKTLAYYETDMVMIVPCLAKQFKERLALLKPLTKAQRASTGDPRFLSAISPRQPNQGRFRMVANPRDLDAFLNLLQSEGMIQFPLLFLTDNMKSVGLNPTVEIPKIKTRKPDAIVATREVEIQNFCKMSLVLWLNPSIDEDLPGGPSPDAVETAHRQIVNGICRHGTVVFELHSLNAMLDFLSEAKGWVSKLLSFRLLVSHHNFRTLTGKETLPDYSSTNITSLLLSVRTKLGLPKVPVLIFSTDLISLHDSVYSLPMAKPTDSIEEVIDFSAMWPLPWAPEWSLFDNLSRDTKWCGELHVFDVACFNLSNSHRSSGHISPYIVASIKTSGKTSVRFKTRKQDSTTSPNWMSLNWILHARAGDMLHFVVKSKDSIVGKDTHLGEIEINLRDFFRSPLPLLEVTWPFVARKGSSRPISGTIMLRLGLAVAQKNARPDSVDLSSGKSSPDLVTKGSEAWKEETRTIKLQRGAHFGRPLGDSMHHAEEVGLRHVAHGCILFIMDKGINSLGIFRVVGSRKKVREAQLEIDAGREAALDDPFVAASLLKQYLRDLPDPLISSHVYKQLLALQAVPSYKELLPELKRIFGLLSRVHRDLLADMLEMLHLIAENESVNMMTARNLATVMAPTLCVSKTMTSMIDINELLLDTNAIIDLVHIMITFNRYIFPELPEDEPLPQAILDLDPTSDYRLDRSPPSSAENSDAE